MRLLARFCLLGPHASPAHLLPPSRRCSVGKNRVKLHLKKAGQYDYWATLAAKKGKAAAAQAAKSPDGGIMDMMRESACCRRGVGWGGGGDEASVGV